MRKKPWKKCTLPFSEEMFVSKHRLAQELALAYEIENVRLSDMVLERKGTGEEQDRFFDDSREAMHVINNIGNRLGIDYKAYMSEAREKANKWLSGELKRYEREEARLNRRGYADKWWIPLTISICAIVVSLISITLRIAMLVRG